MAAISTTPSWSQTSASSTTASAGRSSKRGPEGPVAGVVDMNRSYLLISPCRNEAEYMRQTLDSVVSQSVRPAKWVIVDDGSTDATPQILLEYAARHDWIQ